MRKAIGATLGLLLLLSLGCASFPRPRSAQTEEDPERRELAELRQRVLELQRQAAMTEVELDRLRQQVARLEAGRSAADGAVPRPPSSPPASLPPSDGELAEASLPRPQLPALEVSDLEPEHLEAAGEAVPAGASGAPAPAGPAAGEAANATIPDGSTQTGPISPAGQALYDRGYTSFHQGRYLDAESAFQRFLADFGSTDLADNAQFWIGESRYARGDLTGALAAFRETVSRYPQGNKVPDALLKEADCQRQLGDLEGARTSYEEVIRRFPAAAASAVAEDRLREMQ